MFRRIWSDRDTFPCTQQNGPVISGKHKKDRAAFSITNKGIIIAQAAGTRADNDIPLKGKRQDETKGASPREYICYVFPSKSHPNVPLVVSFDDFNGVFRI